MCCWFKPACHQLLLGLLQWGTNSATGIFRWLMEDKRKLNWAMIPKLWDLVEALDHFTSLNCRKFNLSFFKGTQLLLAKVRGQITQTHTQYMNIFPFFPWKNCIFKFSPGSSTNSCPSCNVVTLSGLGFCLWSIPQKLLQHSFRS